MNRLNEKQQFLALLALFFEELTIGVFFIYVFCITYEYFYPNSINEVFKVNYLLIPIILGLLVIVFLKKNNNLTN